MQRLVADVELAAALDVLVDLELRPRRGLAVVDEPAHQVAPSLVLRRFEHAAGRAVGESDCRPAGQETAAGRTCLPYEPPLTGHWNGTKYTQAGARLPAAQPRGTQSRASGVACRHGHGKVGLAVLGAIGHRRPYMDVDEPP